jgi:hypothetical protein
VGFYTSVDRKYLAVHVNTRQELLAGE